jgi:hypothetical protein
MQVRYQAALRPDRRDYRQRASPQGPSRPRIEISSSRICAGDKVSRIVSPACTGGATMPTGVSRGISPALGSAAPLPLTDDELRRELLAIRGLLLGV